MKFAIRIRSKIKCFLLAHLKRDVWFVFEQDLSGWQFGAPKAEISAGIVSRDEFIENAGRFREIVPSAEARFASGDLCFGASMDGKYAHMKWVGLGRWYDSDTGRYMQLGSDAAYVYDGFTLPEFRGLGLTSVVLDKTFQYLSKIGVKRVYSLIDRENSASLRVKQKENARKIGAIAFFRVFGFKLLRFSCETRQDKKRLTAIFSS